jgi:hypothetical protein
MECGGALQTAESVPVRTSRLAIASFVLAVVGSIGIILFVLLCFFEYPVKVFSWDLFALLPGVPCFCYPIAYVLTVLLGVMARRRIEARPARLAGLWLARAGVVLGTHNIVLGFVLHIVVSFVQFPGPAIDGPPTRITRARIEMRSLATAIEAYYVDNNTYPAWGIGANGPGGAWTYNYSLAPRSNADQPRLGWYYTRKDLGRFIWYEKTPCPDHPADQLSFALNGQGPGQRFATLTTPKAYIASYPTDGCNTLRGATFAYWSVFHGRPDPSGRIVGKDSPTSHGGWILVSPGPDCKYDILPDDWDVYNPGLSQPSQRLLTGTNKKGRAFTYDPTNGTISDGDIWRVKQ